MIVETSKITADFFPNFSPDARIWVYQSSRKLTTEEQATIHHELSAFVQEWAAHGAKLKAQGEVISDYHLALVVEGEVAASGCSIDASVKFIKQVGSQHGIDFFNRLNILLADSEEYVHFTKLSEHLDSEMYNPMIEKLGQLDTNWRVKVADFLGK